MNCYLVEKVIHYCNISVPFCARIDEKTTDFYDLTFVLSGSMTYRADGVTYTLRKNDAIFLPPGTLRSRQEGTEPVRYVSFNFHMSAHTEISFPPYLPNCVSGDIRTLISAFPHSHLSPYYHSGEKLANLLNYILFELLDVSALKCSNTHVLNMLRFIDENITQRLTLQTVSCHVGLSREYACTLFRRETGQSLTNYINERKIHFARDLILNREMSLTDVATYLGYTNYNYFSRLFRRYFDVPPIALKRSR